MSARYFVDKIEKDVKGGEWLLGESIIVVGRCYSASKRREEKRNGEI